MILGTVVGTVVAEKRADRIEAAKYLLIEQCRQDGTGTKNFLVALDMIGAGPGEMVILSQGSAARQTPLTDNRPMDAIIVGIVDCIDEHGTVAYQK
ncbi:ethanolamine utilization protein EutN [candidate division KSB3 bacterium]|uniref:Ethanolamine utilization protein EutN n=1 Tax=candidate division KSB3 bacterium TaxID=2044937 RepID=A0A2G6KGS0_9BACT|nr:MAG: ethanolamine utilization protein EutN [candidate division KSB3 bacterium]